MAPLIVDPAKEPQVPPKVSTSVIIDTFQDPVPGVAGVPSVDEQGPAP